MEHILQFGITIDDDTIRKRVEENAFDCVVEQFVTEMKLHLPKRFAGSIDWDRVAWSCVENFIEENKEEVMELAAKRLVEKVYRTKAWREKYGEAIEGGAE